MPRFTRDEDALTTSLYATAGSSFVDSGDVAELKRISAIDGQSSRYNLHASPASSLHSMVILQPFGAYRKPKKHLGKPKIYHIVDGEMVVVIFEEDGSVRAAHHLASDKVLVIHVEADCYHTNMALTPQAVYHEVTVGPFERASADRVFASFAPDDSEQERGLEYVREAVASLRSDIALD
jgi:cupin fold WbuC family metalloprotein